MFVSLTHANPSTLWLVTAVMKRFKPTDWPLVTDPKQIKRGCIGVKYREDGIALVGAAAIFDHNSPYPLDARGLPRCLPGLPKLALRDQKQSDQNGFPAFCLNCNGWLFPGYRRDAKVKDLRWLYIQQRQASRKQDTSHRALNCL